MTHRQRFPTCEDTRIRGILQTIFQDPRRWHDAIATHLVPPQRPWAACGPASTLIPRSWLGALRRPPSSSGPQTSGWTSMASGVSGRTGLTRDIFGGSSTLREQLRRPRHTPSPRWVDGPTCRSTSNRCGPGPGRRAVTAPIRDAMTGLIRHEQHARTASWPREPLLADLGASPGWRRAGAQPAP